MKTMTKTLLVVFAVAGGLMVASQARAVSFTKKEKSSLAAGKTVKQPLAKSGVDGFFGGTGYTVINAPIDSVWAAIEDWNAYRKVYPNTVSVKEVSRKGNRSLIRMEQGHRLLSVSYFVDVERDAEKKMISFNLVKNKPHDIEETRGYWRLFPQKDGSTLVAYAVAVQVPMGIVSILGWSMSRALERALLGVPGSLKKWMEGPSGNRYRTLTASK